MSLEKSSLPYVVGFDGMHRIGKGTQASMLQEAISQGGCRSVILRGDGTREGLGETAGDPYSEEWQARSRYVKSSEGNTVENWNAASSVLMNELVQARRDNAAEYDALIVDRTLLSRVAFLLHRGTAPEGTRLTFEDMYPGVSDENIAAMRDAVPGIIFNLQVSSPSELLTRLDKEDPKYDFRKRNIRDGFHAAVIAKEHLPEDIEDRVVTIDASQEVQTIHQTIRTHLAYTALNQFL